MKILWLTPIFPYPLYSGGQTRAYNLLKCLAKTNEITLFSFWRPGRIQGPTGALKKFCTKVVTFPGRKTWTLRNILLAGVSSLPFAITHFYGDQKMIGALRKEIQAKRYDLLHFESFYTSLYLRTAFGIPTVLGNENIEYLVYQRFVGLKKPPLKWLLAYDVWKMKRFEQAAWKKADLNLAVSESDAEFIAKISGKKCPVIPNGVDVDYFCQFKSKKRSPSEPTLLFVGDFRYFANQEAIKYLLKAIWPLVSRRLPKVKLKLVGKNPPAWLLRLKTDRVLVDTQVVDIREVYALADVFLAPMQIGSGTNIKILEAMAAGLPVVATPVGIEGIKARPGHEVIVADQPQEFAHRVVTLLRVDQRRQQLAAAGRRLVTQKYDWSKIGQKLHRVYQELLDEKKG